MEAKEIETLVGELETRVDRLRALYEQYFMGIERIVPSVAHKDVERRIYTLRKEQIRNTAVRFRFQMVIQRYNTYQSHWQRVCRQIEEGTYKRDRLRAESRLKPAAPQPVAEAPREASAPDPLPEPAAPPAPAAPAFARPSFQSLELEPLGDFAELDRVLNAPAPVPNQPAPPPVPVPPAKPAVPRPVWRKIEPKGPAPAAAAPAPAAPKPPPPVPRSPADLSDARLRQLYSEYVQTRRSHNESTAALTYDALAKSLRDSSAKLREKHGKSVDFEVTVKDGKTVLKPVVKR